ncbi:MAG: LacI family transcriptional regulator [Paraglaciecola sp.]
MIGYFALLFYFENAHYININRSFKAKKENKTALTRIYTYLFRVSYILVSMKKKVRIKDIADKVGVSTGTVDRVLHNRGNVAADVKQQILDVVDELGYERNLLASALAYNRTVRIVALLPQPEVDDYWRQIDSGLQKAAISIKHYGVILEAIYFDYGNPKSFVEQAKKVLSKQIEGIVFPPMFSEEAKWLIEECHKKSIPNVMINTQLENPYSLSYIGQDSYQSGILAGRLLDFGLTEGQTACIINLDYSTKAAHHLHEKERGFRDYFSKKNGKNIKIIRENFEDFNDSQKLQIFLTEILQKHKSLHSFFVTNSRSYKIVESLEKITDKPIKIVGFDLIKENLKYLQKDKINFLINQNPSEQGFLGIINLFKHLILKEPVEKKQYLPLDIVVKENVNYYLREGNNLSTFI